MTCICAKLVSVAHSNHFIKLHRTYFLVFLVLYLKTTSLNSLEIMKKSPITEYSHLCKVLTNSKILNINDQTSLVIYYGYFGFKCLDISRNLRLSSGSPPTRKICPLSILDPGAWIWFICPIYIYKWPYMID